MSKEINTSCKGCAFALWKIITQTGCAANRIEAFRDKNVLVAEAYDEEREFFVVVDRVCMYHRPLTWRNVNASDEDEAKRARTEIPFPYHAIIIGGNSTRDILNTIMCVYAQKMLPKKITVVRPPGTLSELDTIRKFLELKTDTQPIQWKIENIVNAEVDTMDKFLKLALTTDKHAYFVVFHADTKPVPAPDMMSTIANKVIDDLFQFAMIKGNDNGSGLVIPLTTWKYYRITGDRDKTTVENIEEDLKCQGIHQIRQILPNFPK